MSEKEIVNKIKSLKSDSGSHSPSMLTIIKEIPAIKLKVDACFLSNPYATDLFLHNFYEDIILKNKFKDLVASYPSQNKIISKSIGKYYGMSEKYFFATNGAIEGIQAVIHNLTKKKILINIPTFSSYYEFILSHHMVIYNKLKKEENFRLNIDEFYSKIIKHKPDTVVLINPNNPDGNYVNQDEIEWIIKKCKFIDNFIIDESFIHFAHENDINEIPSAIYSLLNHKNLIIVKSMSKDFGVAGLRIGFMAMDPSRIDKLLSNGYLWNVSGIAEYFFDLCNNKKFWQDYNSRRKMFIKETQEFYLNLSRLDWIKTFPSKSNFILVEIVNGYKAEEVMHKLLLQSGVYVRNCDDKIGLDGQFLRVASRGKEDNKIIFNAFKKITPELNS